MHNDVSYIAKQPDFLASVKINLLLVHQDHALINWFENQFARDAAMRVVSTTEAALTILKNGYKADLVISDVQIFGRSTLDFFVETKYLLPLALRVVVSKRTDATEVKNFGSHEAIHKFVSLPRSGDDLRHQIKTILAQINIAKSPTQKKVETKAAIQVSPQAESKSYQSPVPGGDNDTEKKYSSLERDYELLNNRCLSSAKFLCAFIPEFSKYYYSNHALVVAEIVQAIGAKMNLKTTELHHLTLAALLHDIGKCGMDPKLLSTSQDLLSRPEHDEYLQHIFSGAELLKQLEGMAEVADIVAQHHEHFDGSGFPLGLEAKQISLLSNIICIADIYHNRVYRIPQALLNVTNDAGMKAECSPTETEYRQSQAISFIRLHSGWFAPKVFEAFIQVAEKGDCAHLKLGTADSGNDSALVDAIAKKYIAMQGNFTVATTRGFVYSNAERS